MPHFSECCGVDEYICQKCRKIHCSECEPSSWMGDITESKHVGNICPTCLKKYTDWKLLKGKPKNLAKPGDFTGIIYEITVANINKLVIRNKCPHCEHLYNMENHITTTDDKWIFKCPTCSAVIQVVR